MAKFGVWAVGSYAGLRGAVARCGSPRKNGSSICYTIVLSAVCGRENIRSINDMLDSLNPLSILQRGYSITKKLPEMSIVKDSNQVKTGDEVSILLAKGSIKGIVKKTAGNKE